MYVITVGAYGFENFEISLCGYFASMYIASSTTSTSNTASNDE